MKPLLILLLLFTSCNPYRELKRYNKRLEKWDEYFKKEQLKNKEDEAIRTINNGIIFPSENIEHSFASCKSNAERKRIGINPRKAIESC